MTVKKQLRATYGLDSANEKVINVGYPQDFTDGVNIQYFIDNNTVQNYDSSRGYDEGFVVQFKNKLFISNRKITKPAGEFELSDWNAIRTDIQWKTFNHIQTFQLAPEVGEQILYDIRYQQRTIVLPDDPQHGDTVWIKDNFNALAYNRLTVETRKFSLSTGGSIFYPSIPGETNLFVWDNNQKYWRVFRFVQEVIQNTVKSRVKSNRQEPTQVGVLQTVTVDSREENHEIKFPIFANDNEIITVIDEHKNLGAHPLTIYTFNQSYKINNQQDQFVLDKPGVTKFIYKASDKNWIPVYDAPDGWKKITSNYTTKAGEKLHLQPANNITITLPKNASLGDVIDFANANGFQRTVQILPGNPSHVIVGDINQQYNRKFQQLTKGNPVDAQQFVLPNNGQGTFLQLTYLEQNKWYVSNFSTRIEHVDENNRDRPGIASLATQAEVDKNHEQNPRDDQIVTPKTLANSTANETRRGIARIATQAETNVNTQGNHLDDVIVTPKKLNSRQATEEIRGVAEVATVAETKDNNNDTHIITPKKLNSRVATQTLNGVQRIATNSEVDAGNHSGEVIITPAGLKRWTRIQQEAQFTEQNRGTGRASTITETWQGSRVTGQNVYTQFNDQLVVTPRKLNYALQNYLPIEGKAVDQDKLDDLDSLQFLRSDVDTTNTAKLTVNKETTVGALKLKQISTTGTQLTENSLKDKSGGLIYQNNNNFIFDNNLNTADKFIFNLNGQEKAQLDKNGLFNTTTVNSTNQNMQNLNVTNQMTFKGRNFNDYFVKSDGHVMSGNLGISNTNAKLQLGSTQNNTNQQQVEFIYKSGNTTDTWDLLQNTNGFQLRKDTQNVLRFNKNKVATFASGINVGSTNIVDNNAKIQYNILKDVPTAQIQQFGITKLSHNLDENSPTLAPQMKAFNDLKNIVDNKADIVGSEYNNIRIKEYLQIGNIRLVPDYENKTINFVWYDTSEESN